MIMTQFDTLKAQQGKQHNMEWAAFCRFIHNAPTYPEKIAQPLIKLATFANNSRANGSALSMIYGIELDYDDGVITPEQAAQTLNHAGIRAIICSTYNSTANSPKWRAFLPISKPYEAKHRAALVGACDSILGHVVARESYTTKQIFFIGRNPNAEYTVIECHGEPLDTLPIIHQAARDYLQQRKQETQAAQQAQAKTLQRAKLERLTDRQVSVIEAFNEAYDVGAVIQTHGYIQKGQRFMAPNSKSGLAGVVLLDNHDGKPRCFSHHGTDPLNNGHANDAFDVFCILEHGDDVSQAIQAAGNLLYVGNDTLTEYNRKAYWLSREAT